MDITTQNSWNYGDDSAAARETKAKSPFAKKIIASADCTTKMADWDTELIPFKIGNSSCRFIAGKT